MNEYEALEELAERTVKKVKLAFWGVLLVLALFFLFCLIPGVRASSIPISVQINDTQLVLSDPMNTKTLELGNVTTSVTWSLNDTVTGFSYINQYLQDINDSVNARCSNLSVQDIKNTINARLDTQLSTFQDQVTNQLTPLSTVGPEYTQCQADKASLSEELGSKTVNDTQLTAQIAICQNTVQSMQGDSQWATWLAYGEFILLVLAVVMFYGGGSDLIRRLRGGGE